MSHILNDTPTFCRHCCSDQPLFTDRHEGDKVCTSCGVVSESHIFELGAEWVDYQNDSDFDPYAIESAQARCGMVPVNEFKFAGGLEPTILSSEPYRGPKGTQRRSTVAFWQDGSDPTVIAAKEATIRQRLIKTTRFLERWTKKSLQESLEQAKLNIEVEMCKKRKRPKSTRGEGKEDGEEDTSSTSSSTSSSNMEDFMQPHHSALADSFFSEHVTMVQQKQVLRTKVIQDTWSLTQAVFLHGSELDPDYESSVSQYYSLRIPDLEDEKSRIWKDMDPVGKRASAQLYHASRMLLQAMQRLGLSSGSIHNTLNSKNTVSIVDEAMQLLCSFASKNQGFTIRGIAQRADTHTLTHQSTRKDLLRSQREKNQMAQMAAIGSGVIYLICKKQGVGRLVNDICASFHDVSVEDRIPVKPKHCFKAIHDIKLVFPTEFEQDCTTTTTPTAAAATTTRRTTTATTSQEMDSWTDIPTSVPYTSTLQDGLSKDLVSLSSLIQHSLAPLCLPLECLFTITCLTLDLKVREQKGFVIWKGSTLSMSKSSSKLMTVLLSTTIFIGQVSDVLQRLATQVIESKQNRTPPNMELDCTMSCHETEKPPQATTFDLFAHDAVVKGGKKEDVSSLSFWYAWKNQPCWKRDWEVLEKLPCVRASISTLREFYKKNIHASQRLLLLQSLQRLSRGGDPTLGYTWDMLFQCFQLEQAVQEKVRVLFKDITLAAPLIPTK